MTVERLPAPELIGAEIPTTFSPQADGVSSRADLRTIALADRRIQVVRPIRPAADGLSGFRTRNWRAAGEPAEAEILPKQCVITGDLPDK
jgi:hypothetical protein